MMRRHEIGRRERGAIESGIGFVFCFGAGGTRLRLIIRLVETEHEAPVTSNRIVDLGCSSGACETACTIQL